MTKLLMISGSESQEKISNWISKLAVKKLAVPTFQHALPNHQVPIDNFCSSAARRVISANFQACKCLDFHFFSSKELDTFPSNAFLPCNILVGQKTLT